MIRVLIGIYLSLSYLSAEKEAALGKQIARDVRSRTVAIANPEIQLYVTAIGLRLAAHASSPFPWTFEVVTGLDDRPPYEPLSIPGGYVFIPLRLLQSASSEREFAQMLAHSMAHQILRDTTRFVKPDYATIPLTFIGTNNAALPLAFRTLQEQKEQAAERKATEIMQDIEFNGAIPQLEPIQRRLIQRSVPSLFSH